VKFLVIAYPELADEDLLRIESYRRENDKMFDIVRPHFTFVFPVTDFSVTDFTTEIKKQLGQAGPISFCLRCAVINKDDFSEYYHAFLVPDEGFSEIVKLHDRLYSGKLSVHHRLDIDFIPHIGIGNSTDKSACKKMVDDWNSQPFLISGIISALDIVQYENDKVTTIERIKLNETT
jgi:2'-5' RNA ligase superfamily